MDLLLVFKSHRKLIGFPINKNTASTDVTDPSVEGGVIEIPLVYDLYFPDFFDRKSYCFIAQYATELTGGFGPPKRFVMCLKKSVTMGDSGWVCNMTDSYTVVVNSVIDRPEKNKFYQSVRTPATGRVRRHEVEVISRSSASSEPPQSDASSGFLSGGIVCQDSGDEICVDGAASDDSGDRLVRNIRLQLGDYMGRPFANLYKFGLGLPG